MHPEIGRLLLEDTPERNLEELLLTVVDHLNISSDLLKTRDEKLKLVHLNLRAGLKAKASTAYASALAYLTAGADLLTEDCWDLRHDLVFSLQLNRAECEFLVSELSVAEQQMEILSTHAADTVEQAAATCLRMDFFGCCALCSALSTICKYVDMVIC